MELELIEFNNLATQSHFLFDQQNMLLTCGDFLSGDFNTMTIGWGSLGTMWNRPFALVVVRPTRYTFEFMEKYDDFTITAFPDEYRSDLKYLGTHSGRTENKLLKTKLTPKNSSLVKSPTFSQAELSIECKKIYYTDFNPSNFLETYIHRQYPKKDYHRVYYGEILAIHGSNKYNSQP